MRAVRPQINMQEIQYTIFRNYRISIKWIKISLVCIMNITRYCDSENINLQCARHLIIFHKTRDIFLMYFWRICAFPLDLPTSVTIAILSRLCSVILIKKNYLAAGIYAIPFVTAEYNNEVLSAPRKALSLSLSFKSAR